MRSFALALCVAAYLLPAAAFATAPPSPAVEDCSLSGTDSDAERTLQGGISAQSYDLVVKWLHANPHRALTLHLHSKGGLVLFGAKLYDAIEAQGQVTTDVAPGQSCSSACTYVWLAGRVRTVAERAFLGFHSVFCGGPCDGRGIGLFNQILLDTLARTEPALAVLLSNTGVMISGRRVMAVAIRENGHWALRTFEPPT